MFGARLKHRDDLEEVPVANERFDGMARDQNLTLRHTNIELRTEPKPLRDDPHQAVCQLRSHVVLDFGGNAPTTRCSASRQVEEWTVPRTR